MFSNLCFLCHAKKIPKRCHPCNRPMPDGATKHSSSAKEAMCASLTCKLRPPPAPQTRTHVHLSTSQVQCRYPAGCAAPSRVRCQCNTRGPLSKLGRMPPQWKIHVTSKSPVGDISVVTLVRTDTTLDHSQKAEKVCMHYEHWTEYGTASMETYVSGVCVEKMPVDLRTSGVTKNVRVCVCFVCR